MTRLRFLFITLATSTIVASAAAKSCVWKVTAPDGKTLYLGGSVHTLRKSDYPLPPEYLRAYEASSHLAFEVDTKALEGTTRELRKAAQYPKGDTLKNHVDPRTYAYMRRLFDLLNVPEEALQRVRPWAIVLELQTATMRGGVSHDLGVDQFLMQRAKKQGKPVVGLESAAEHASVYSGLTDRQAEILLLVTFIPDVTGSGKTQDLMKAWRSGDVETLTAIARSAYREFPEFGVRLLDQRNHAWLPKLEGFLRSGRTYLVTVGAGHLGGPQGVLALLRARGYQLEQL